LRLQLLILGLVCVARGQATPLSRAIPQASEIEIRERISTIIRETIRQGEGTVAGVKFWTRVPPSSERVDEIKAYEDKRIPVLEEYMWAESGPEADLALRFLGLLGGSRIVEPLKRVAEKSSSAGRRQLALMWLTQAPWDLASPIIRNA